MDRYRVLFTFLDRPEKDYRSEWFDTFGEAIQFVLDGGALILANDDEQA